MAYYHGYLVYRLYFLSHFRVQADAEDLEVFTGKIRRCSGKKSAGIPVFFCSMVYHRYLARRKLELYCLGPYELRGDHDLPGTGASVQKVPPPVPGERQEMVRRL